MLSCSAFVAVLLLSSAATVSSASSECQGIINSLNALTGGLELFIKYFSGEQQSTEGIKPQCPTSLDWSKCYWGLSSPLTTNKNAKELTTALDTSSAAIRDLNSTLQNKNWQNPTTSDCDVLSQLVKLRDEVQTSCNGGLNVGDGNSYNFLFMDASTEKALQAAVTNFGNNVESLSSTLDNLQSNCGGTNGG